jgi:hypothetical protein
MIRKLRSFAALAGAVWFACWNPAVAQTPAAPCLSINNSAPASCSSSTTSGPASDPFPRTYINMIGGSPNLLVSGNTNAGVPFSTVVEQSTGVLAGVYLGFEQVEHTTVAALMQSWKAGAQANGLTLRTFIYTQGQAFTYTNPAPYPWVTNALNSSSMWAYTSASGSGTTDLLSYSYTGNTGQSYIQITPYNSQTLSSSFSYNGKTGVLAGYNVWNLYAQYFYDVLVNGLAASKYGEAKTYAPNPYLDGVMLDNMAPSAPKTAATWMGLGTAPVGVTAVTTAATQQGDAKQANAFRALKSNFLVWYNGSLTGLYINGGYTVDPTYKSLKDVSMAEGTVGYSWSIETWDNSPPGQWMQGLIADEVSITPGGTLVFHQVGGPGGANDLTGNQSSWGATQWQAVRFGFAAAMQRNWHYMLNCGQGAYSSVGLTDEQVQTVNGKANYGWLSAGTQRLDPPQSEAWSNGVWRRRFPNGWVLWNPRGNGAQTVTIPSTLCRIKTRGYGNSSVNNGACGATSVTLQDADGLFLIGTG